MFIQVLTVNNTLKIINSTHITEIQPSKNNTYISFNSKDFIVVKQSYEEFYNTLVKMGMRIHDVSR